MNNKQLYIYIGICLLIIIVLVVLVSLYYSFKENNTSEDKFANTTNYNFIAGNTVKITCQNCDNLPPPYNPANGSDVNLFGVFIYGKDGNLLNTEPTSGWALLSTIYPSNFNSPENALTYPAQFSTRTLTQAISTQLSIDTSWNTSEHCSASGSGPSPGTNPGWWKYTFNSPQDISGIEIYSRSDNCAERISNALIQIFDSSDNEVWRTNFRNITDLAYGTYNKPLKPADVWETFITTNYTQPTTTNYTQPTTTNYTQPATTAYTQPATTAYTQPATTAYTQPENTYPQPTTDIFNFTIDKILPRPTTGLNAPRQNKLFPIPENVFSAPTMPLISPSQTIALLNTGANVDTLTSQGIAMNSAFRGPSTNIVQTNFSGTSNIYSPYLYYNKGLSESFSGLTTDTGKNYFTY